MEFTRTQKHFNSASDFYQKLFGCKVYKISLDSGCTCPNRDGTLGTGGCIFCSEGGSGEFAASRNKSITDQIEEAKKLVIKKANGRKGRLNKFIAYFQNFTNTYGNHEKLEKMWREALNNPDIVGISIATRPDCIDNDMINRISKLSQETFIQIELGLQTANDLIAKQINRCYETKVYDSTLKKLKSSCLQISSCKNGINNSIIKVNGLHVVTQLIFGLPGESFESMKNSILHAIHNNTDGIKITSLYVLRGTDLEKDYNSDKLKLLSEKEYLTYISEALQLIPKEVVIHRLTGDGPKNILLAPQWTAYKRKVLNDMNAFFETNKIFQGTFV